jgi:site-specific recombinase XerD
MDTPADPATPFREVYQPFLAVLKKRGLKDNTRAKYRYHIKRFERWLHETGRPLDPRRAGQCS